MKVLILLVGVVAALIILGWLGLQIPPRSLPAFPRPTSGLQAVPWPEGLPAPVEHFYRQVYGEHLPLIESAVITGRATMRVRGITLPGRFRFRHQAGRGYRHDLDATLFGVPLLRVHESYRDGRGRLEWPFGVTEGEPNVNQGANLALWGESVFWLPAVLLTAPRVRWEPVDAHTALLVVPFGAQDERVLVRFAPATGLPHLLEAMRYRDPTAEAKLLWLVEARGWETLNGHYVPTVATITWVDEGMPWATFTVEDVVYNGDVHAAIHAKGPPRDR